MASNRQEFIRSQTRCCPVAFVPEIALFVADEATSLWHLTEVELGAVRLPPPFWAFAWAGGQAVARYLIDHPSLVAGKRVLDFASGSGLVAIAAGKAGARTVEASEIDPFALAAIDLNAKLNNVDIILRRSDVVGLDEGWQVVVAGDVSYERDMAARVTDWLDALARRRACVLVGDPGRTYLARDRLHSIASYPIPVTHDIEDAQIKKTDVWQFNSAPQSARAPAIPRAE
jgi:predicted nicotinamide N-methyase